ncbi:MAG: aminotransferase class I/II-fold pyridoxal phosphate-dependent enzyme [Clostridia bacterium]|nr:aminotransferase class I/II-fold pyridoxal phosphate-dependent enzyme [Clostridia bacterium]
MPSLLSFLKSYTKSFLPMHMPGGKRLFRSDLPYQWDVTDLEATDDLYRPSGVLKELQDRAAAVWGADCSFLLVNGSTSGILSAVRATGDGDILAARNSHKSFFNAAELCRRKTFFLCPESAQGIPGSIEPAQIRSALQAHPSVTTVFLTSPTYEGVVSDIASIAEICREAGATLIVDEAHGAHFGFASVFPESAVTLGADIVIQSLHKTLPALTQTAVLHCRSEWFERISRELPVFQTSSPSYILLASADECIRYISDGSYFEEYAERLSGLRAKLAKLNHLKLLDGSHFYGYDPGKLVFLTPSGASGADCANLLRNRFGIETEMSLPRYFLAMTSVCDTEETFSRFLDAVRATDDLIACADRPESTNLPRYVFSLPEKVLESFEVRNLRMNICSYKDSPNRISAEYVFAYPPGIPILIPGERIPENFPETVSRFAAAGCPLRFAFGADDGIAVCG